MSERLDLERGLRGTWIWREERVMLDAMANRAPLLRVVDARDARDAYVARACGAMRAEPSRRWTVAALGRVAGLSRAALARRFTCALGVSPLRWLAEVRLRLAGERLVESDLPLAAIAGEVGYRCEFAFAKAFKRIVGLPPGVFRRVARARRATTAAPVFRAAA